RSTLAWHKPCTIIISPNRSFKGRFHADYSCCLALQWSGLFGESRYQQRYVQHHDDGLPDSRTGRHRRMASKRSLSVVEIAGLQMRCRQIRSEERGLSQKPARTSKE